MKRSCRYDISINYPTALTIVQTQRFLDPGCLPFRYKRIETVHENLDVEAALAAASATAKPVKVHFALSLSSRHIE